MSAPYNWPQPSNDVPAAMADMQTAMKAYYIVILEDFGEPVDPEKTYQELQDQLITKYQALLTAAGAPYDEYELQADYVPSPESPFDYTNYLANIYATVPGS